jgi:hypothetical protein
VPTAKPKPGTAAYCQTPQDLELAQLLPQEGERQRQDHDDQGAATTTAKKTKKPTTTPAAPKQPDVGQLSPSSAPAPAPSGGTVAVPPLPQKTI